MVSIRREIVSTLKYREKFETRKEDYMAISKRESLVRVRTVKSAVPGGLKPPLVMIDSSGNIIVTNNQTRLFMEITGESDAILQLANFAIIIRNSKCC
jgi:hypothetical protein